VFFANRVPPEARDAYSKDAMSGILGAVMSGMTVPFFIVIARYRLHASQLEVAFLTMAPVAGYLLCLIWANMMQGRRKMPYAVWSWIIARCLLFAVLFATCSGVFVGIVVLFWLICSIAQPAYSDLMKEVYPDGDRAKIMGYARVCTAVSGLILIPIAGKLMEHVSYRCVFPVAAVFGVISALVFGRIEAKQASGGPQIRLHRFVADSIRLLVEDKGYLWFCAAIFVFGFANFVAAPAFVLYEVDVLKAHEFRQSIYALVGSAIATVSYFYWGRYVDRRTPARVVAWQMFAWAFIPLTYLAASQWWMLLPAKVLSGFVGAGADLAYLTGVIYFAPPDRVFQYQAVFMTLMGIRGVAATMIGGIMLQWHVASMPATFALSAALTFASVIVQVVGYRRHETAGKCRSN
jgi:hypothetical protein